ncbi:MAG: LamG-like jellyroll fold domain-containing protein [Pirellulales bacterium]|nr:LamG-like jellyroll fold domain-containing protein [Pirellulales bacterium]
MPIRPGCIYAGFCFLVCLALCWGGLRNTVLAHPDHEEPGLLFHFVATGHPIENGAISDQTHHVTAKLVGQPKLQTLGPAEGLTFNGTDEFLLLAEDYSAAKAALPTKEFTAAAWVNLARAEDAYGGIIGTIQDNGGSEQGWLLGFNNNRFSLALATTGGDDGQGKLTYMKGKTPIELGRWYHVAGVYDGKTMRLYVNGQLDAESTEQSGEIHYPPKSAFVMGAFHDNDEKYMLEGSIYEAKLYNRALPAEDFVKIAAKNDNLTKYVNPATKQVKFLVQPYLQFGTRTSMAVMCETNRPAKMTVEYGPKQPLANKLTSDKPGLIHTCILENLPQGEPQFYRVTCVDEADPENSVQSGLFSLQTDRGPEHAWAFGIIGDTQRNPAITRKCAEGIYSHRPNMLIHCGDVVDDGYAKNQWLKDLFEPMHPLLARAPMFPTIGNHEGNSHWYYDYFHLPQPEYYYTFTYGNAQFFMVDSNKSLAPNSEQYKWLDSELAKSKATWKFTCHHHPCFSSDENDYGDHNTGNYRGQPTYGDTNAQHVIPLYEKYGVDIAFNGHIHVYERTWPIYRMTINQKKGVRYITSGGGGGGLEQSTPQRTWFNLEFKRAHHYCMAVIHDRTIQFKAYDVEERLFDTFELTKDADR